MVMNGGTAGNMGYCMPGGPGHSGPDHNTDGASPVTPGVGADAETVNDFNSAYGETGSNIPVNTTPDTTTPVTGGQAGCGTPVEGGLDPLPAPVDDPIVQTGPVGGADAPTTPVGQGSGGDGMVGTGEVDVDTLIDITTNPAFQSADPAMQKMALNSALSHEQPDMALNALNGLVQSDLFQGQGLEGVLSDAEMGSLRSLLLGIYGLFSRAQSGQSGTAPGMPGMPGNGGPAMGQTPAIPGTKPSPTMPSPVPLPSQPAPVPSPVGPVGPVGGTPTPVGGNTAGSAPDHNCAKDNAAEQTNQAAEEVKKGGKKGRKDKGDKGDKSDDAASNVAAGANGSPVTGVNNGAAGGCGMGGVPNAPGPVTAAPTTPTTGAPTTGATPPATGGGLGDMAQIGQTLLTLVQKLSDYDAQNGTEFTKEFMNMFMDTLSEVATNLGGQGANDLARAITNMPAMGGAGLESGSSDVASEALSQPTVSDAQETPSSDQSSASAAEQAFMQVFDRVL